MNYSPTKLILVFFIAIISLGTLLLSLPFARTDPASLSLLNNLFMSTSSVCVTGLAVVDIGSYYTFFGQLVILALIQIGGLGYMTLSTIIGLFIGRIALKERAMIKELLDISSYAGLLSLLKRIVLIVAAIEAAGSIILTAAFMRQYPFGRALYLGIFHGISAFCNAGLSPFRANLESYAGDWPVIMTTAALIILGGLGFLVLMELISLFRKRETNVSIHTRIVLYATAALIIGGMAGFWVIEYNNTLAGKDLSFSFLGSFFQSVTARTAGFDSLPIGLVHRATAILLIILMFIGASPGGTGGGIKTTTFVLVVLFVVSMLKERESINVFNRRISEDLLKKALTIFILGLNLVIAMTFVLVLTDRFAPIDLLFEVTSAFGTVGLSRGITPELSVAGKLIIILTMIIGRVGPLTFLMALLRKSRQSGSFKFPEEKVMVG